MARRIGSELDAALFERLAGRQLEQTAGKAIVVVSVDEAGGPHPALLSYHEVVAKDRANIRLAPYAGSTLARAARRQGRVTLAIFDAQTASYIKGVATELAPTMTCAPENAKLNLAVTDVLNDDPDPRFEAEAHVTAGVTYHEPNPGQARARARLVLAELLE